MQIIDKATTQEMFTLADELIEVAQVNTLDAAYEVVQVRHDDLVQFVVTRYRKDTDIDTNMSEQSHALEDIEASVVFGDAAGAKLYLIERLAISNFDAGL